ncbi:HpcH/HpaI aldolase/citrate lyase family protein [Brevibacterium sp. CT2-23B]|uniref:HpcH/HpaI aldolase family protein n=1 Tax=Brevibacterium sp. CT2-23B TaxID=2729630 RepID=UPI001553639C|nr:aldolase/citrate lyase family protein [Brevibacterium sp. CT2-23B]
MNTLKSRLGAEVEVGTFLKFPVIESVELMSIAGFDLVVIDLEHSPMSIESAARLLAMAKALKIESLVRIPSHGYEWVQRSLDAGARGVLVPHVDNAEQAEQLVAAAHFPPRGHRGFGPTTRAGGWAVDPETDYRLEANTAALVVQIESGEGVADVEGILAAGVDSVFVGPADLSVALGVEPGSPELARASRTVLDAAKAHGIPCGIAAGSGERARQLVDEGYDYAVVGNDATMLGSSASAMVAAFRR